MVCFRYISLIAALLLPLSALSQQHFPKVIPAGNYSGICSLGNYRYAVVSDKSTEDGFFIFRIVVDTLRQRISNVANEGFRSAAKPNSDMEALCFFPPRQTLFIASESTGEVLEYALDGTPTGRGLPIDAARLSLQKSYGLEALAYDTARHRFFATTERPLRGDSLLNIWTFDDDLQPATTYRYRPDAPISHKYYYGVSALCALNDGRLLVLERQIRIPRLKIGAKTMIRLYEVWPSDRLILQKRLVAEFKTRLTLTSRKFANYEGLCEVAPGLLMLIADSQNQYRGVLRDWIKLLSIEKKN